MTAVVTHSSQVRSSPAAATSTATAVQAFLADLAQAGRSSHTRRAYAGDLRLLVEAAPDRLEELTPQHLRALFAGHAQHTATTRARRQASFASFLAWAYREGLIESDPMGRVARVKQEPPLPRGLSPDQVGALLAAIPPDRVRDRLLLGLLTTTGLRVGEALALHVDDVDLTRDDERLSVLGKGGRRRTVLLDDPQTVRLLRRHLRERGYRNGPLFRAERGDTTTALRYTSVHERFQDYARAAGIGGASLHDLRHGHAQPRERRGQPGDYSEAAGPRQSRYNAAVRRAVGCHEQR